MNVTDFLNAFTGVDALNLSFDALLARTNYDDLLEIDLNHGRFSMLEHVDNKYFGTVSEGDFNRLFSYAADHFVHPDDANAYFAMLDPETLADRLANARPAGLLRGDFRVKGVDGRWIWTRQMVFSAPAVDLPAGVARCYIYDIQRLRQRAEDAPAQPVASEPIREELTGLPEGSNFFRPAQEALERMRDGGCIVAISINHYRRFTDWYGLESCRYLLARVGEILRGEAEGLGAMPGYLGQDQFCLLMPYDMEKLTGLYLKLHDAIDSASRIDGFLPSFGIALIDDSSNQIMEFYNHAALTAEEIPDGTDRRVKLYDAELHRRNAEEFRILHDFQRAMEDGEIFFCLQPQCRVSNHKIVGAESLARWRRLDGSMISPSVFVPILERYGLVPRLDRFVWESVCRWLRGWIDGGHQAVPVSVNVSRIDITSFDVPACFEGLLKKYGLPPALLKVEITESAYVEDASAVSDAIARLQAMGFMVLMDDFGSGYSSLNMLGSVNMDVIKLDAQFLHIEQKSMHKGISILESIVNMTKNMATPIIVEGVETEEQVSFLADLGCRYMQGYYFYRPMPVEDFEALLSEPRNIEPHGFVCKANQQLHVREFLDERIYSDVMLNNILGPVCFYNWSGENVDIVRFNQQFYQLVGIEAEELNVRRFHIQEYLPPEDRGKLYGLLSRAEVHRTVGAKGVIRAIRPNGMLVWLSLQVYFIGEDSQGKKFYASAQDVTELQFISSDMPGGYYRCTLDDDFEFLFISKNFQEMTGYSESEVRVRFDNRLINMVHPEDVAGLREQARAVLHNKAVSFPPYRIRHREKGYIYVADQSRVTDLYGPLCWQSMAVDVTEVMRMRNQLKVLSRFLTDSILLLRRTGEGLVYEVVIHGLADKMGMDAEALQTALNSGEFCKLIEGHEDIPHAQYTERFIAAVAGGSKALTVNLPDRPPLKLLVRADRVDETDFIEYIVVLRSME